MAVPKFARGRLALNNVTSIRTKLLVAMIPALVVALVVMSVIAVTKVTSAQEQGVSQSVANSNAAQAEKFNGQVEGRMSMAEAKAAAGPALIGPTDRAAVENRARRMSVSAQQTSASAEHASASAQQIAASAEDVSRLSVELTELVAQFTLSAAGVDA